MNELQTILKTFAESGYPLIAAPAQRFLRGAGSKEELRQAIERAQKECGSCGCTLDPLYPRALALLALC